MVDDTYARLTHKRTYRIFGKHLADARILADISQKVQEAHGAKPVQVVEHAESAATATIAAAVAAQRHSAISSNRQLAGGPVQHCAQGCADCCRGQAAQGDRQGMHNRWNNG